MKTSFPWAVTIGLLALLVVIPLSAQETETGSVTEMEERYEEHVVVPGDTLWDLSGKYLTDPWKWPEIWELNPFVEDPHWIYPKQVLRIRIISEVVKKPTDTGVGTPDAPIVAPPTYQMPAALLQRKDMSFRLRFKSNLIDFISPRKLKSAGKFIESFNTSYMLGDFDTAYFRYSGEEAITIGDQFTLFRMEEKVRHPVKRRKVGYRVDTVGELEVIDIGQDKRGNTVYTGQIVDATADINVNDRMMPMESRSVKIVLTPATEEIRGYIVESGEGLVAIGDHQLVFLDVGSDDGVKVGNSFQIFRAAYHKRKAPPYYVGNLIVVKTMNETSTAIITYSRKELQVGDMIVSEVAN